MRAPRRNSVGRVRSGCRVLKPRLDFLELRCVLSGYSVTLNSPYEIGTSIAGQSQSYTDVANFQATDPTGSAVTDPAGFKATIDWGDNTSSTGVIAEWPGTPWLFEIDGTHAYPDPSNGEYNVQVTLVDPDGGIWYGAPSIATVDPPPNNLSSSPGGDLFSVEAGHPFSGVVAAVDQVNTNLPVTGLVGQITNYADGTVTPARIVAAGPGSWDVYDSEAFNDPGPNEISVQVGDDQGDTGYVTVTIDVNKPLLPDIVAESATTHDSRSVTFEYAIANAPLTQPFDVTISRSTSATFNPSPAAEVATWTVPGDDLSGQPFGSVGVHYVRIPLPTGLPPDPIDPFIVVQANEGRKVGESNYGNDSASFKQFTLGVVVHGLHLPIPRISLIPPSVKLIPEWVGTLSSELTADGYSQVISANWVVQSVLPKAGQTQQEAKTLTWQILHSTVLQQAEESQGAVLDIHLIAYSRGASVVSQIAEDLEDNSILPQQIRQGFLRMTLIDPHPANNALDLFSKNGNPLGIVAQHVNSAFNAKAEDPDVEVPSIVSELENYYQLNSASKTKDGVSIILGFNLLGEGPIFGISSATEVSNYQITTGVVKGKSRFVAHTQMPQWFLDNVAQHLRGVWDSYQPPGSTLVERSPITIQ